MPAARECPGRADRCRKVKSRPRVVPGVNAPTINTRPANCPNCDGEDTVVPMDIVEEPPDAEQLFTLSYRCISCGDWFNPENP